MLAKRRSIQLAGLEIERTPLLVPSFSSKGFPDVKEIIEYNAETIEGATLVSAYDLHYGYVEPPFDFASLLFLDSGGYEASKDAELSDFGEREHHERPWRRSFHENQLTAWRSETPSVFISYDHPKERLLFSDQVRRAQEMAPERTDIIREILIKPETDAQIRLQMPSILENAALLAPFDIIGVTEKEIGNSIFQRMLNIAKLRKALDLADLQTPIHVFGSLDSVTTPMYFLAGADIFDGLTWLRFAFRDGYTMYKHNFGAMYHGVSTPVHVVNGLCWNNNYYYIKELELEMRRFLSTNSFASFRYHGDLFRKAIESVCEQLEG